MDRMNDRTGSQQQQGEQQQQYGRAEGQQGGTSSNTRSAAPKRDAFEMLRRLDQDVDRLFHDFFGGRLRGRGAGAPSAWVPPVEMWERSGKLHVCADLPGMRRDDIRVTLEDGQLVLQGERRASHDSAQGGYFHTERSYGSFYRAIALPEGVDPQTAEASFRDGVLDVCFDAPRSHRQEARRVEIRD